MFKKYFIKAFLFLFLFLVPVGVHLNTPSSVMDINKSETSNVLTLRSDIEIELSINQAYAIQIECGTSFWGLASGLGCEVGNALLTLFELVWYTVTQIIVVIVGLMMDTFLFASIDGEFYRAGIIENGWEILRDFTNIVFILALLIAAFKMVLGVGAADAKKKVIHTILIALVINFSLFVTYAIIDMSNIFAHVFYNKIDANVETYAVSEYEDADEASIGNVAGFVKNLIGDDKKSVSLSIASVINPQRIIVTTEQNGGELSFIKAYMIVFAAGLLNMVMIWIFLSVSLLFLGRIIGLIFMAILSPLAFSSILIPGLQNNKYIGLKNWFSQLISLSFMAPIYMFFMYLAVTFITDEKLVSILVREQADWLSNILNVYMLIFLIGGVLYFAKKVTEDMAGEIGGMFGKAVAAATGAVVGVGAMAATGGAAGVAKLGGAVLKNAPDGSKRAKWRDGLNSFSSKAFSTKFDVTKIPGFKGVAGETATNLIGKVTGKSLAGHTSGNYNKFVNTPSDVISDETNKLGKEKLDLVKATAKRKADSKTALQWQDDIREAKVDEQSVADIKKTRKDIMKKNSFEDSTKTNKVFIQDLRDAFSKGTVVNVTGTGGPTTATIPATVAPLFNATRGNQPTHTSKDGRSTGTPVSKVEFEEIIVKKLEKESRDIAKEIKTAERAYKEDVQAGNPTTNPTGTGSRNILDKLEREKESVETGIEKFKKETLKAGKEKADQLEASITGRARESVAKTHDTNGDTDAAARIRGDKVKVSFSDKEEKG